MYRRSCPATRLPPRDRSTPPSTRSLNPLGSASTARLFRGFRVFTVVVAFHVERPAKITDRDSADHPFPSRELIGVSPGPSRYWPVRGSPAPRRVTGHAALVQVFNPVRQPARHRRDQNHRSRNRPNPTSRRGHAPTAPAGPVLQQHSTRIAIAATSLPPIPMPPPPRDSIPSTP